MADEEPLDYSLPVNKVRLLIPDTEKAFDGANLFEDSEISAYLDMFDGNIFYAAAQCKDTIATSEALILKVIRTNDWQTDGATLAAELRAQASTLRGQGAQADLDDAAEFFTIVEGRWRFPCI